MGQRNNMLYTGQILETEHGHNHPEPCVVSSYGGIPSFPQPSNNNNNNNHTILPQNLTSFNPQQLPENHGLLPHGISQFNSIDRPPLNHPANNVFMPPAAARVFPTAFNQGIQDQNRQFIDVFKGKNAEAFSGNIQYFYPAAGSSSSVPIPMNTGSYSGQPLQAVSSPWLDQQFCANGSDAGTFSWNHGPNIPYLQGPINGGSLDASNTGLHGYQVATSNRIPGTFVHPPPIAPHQGPHSIHHHLPPPPPPSMPPMQVPNIEFHSQVAPMLSMPRFVGPTQATGLRVFRPHRRELMIGATARHRVFPHLRVLPEDGVAILDISGYHEVGHSVDHHREMRLDIDHMSYEELLALGEQIGSAGSGLSADFILEHLKTRVFASSKSCEPEDVSSADQELNSCVICQTNYDNEEQIGVLDCGHEYHVECVKKWLTVKNTCPVCKSTALAAKAKESSKLKRETRKP